MSYSKSTIILRYDFSYSDKSVFYAPYVLSWVIWIFQLALNIQTVLLNLQVFSALLSHLSYQVPMKKSTCLSYPVSCFNPIHSLLYLHFFQGFYKRVDRLQDDLFSIFEKARREGNSDSEVMFLFIWLLV